MKACSYPSAISRYSQEATQIRGDGTVAFPHHNWYSEVCTAFEHGAIMANSLDRDLAPL